MAVESALYRRMLEQLTDLERSTPMTTTSHSGHDDTEIDSMGLLVEALNQRLIIARAADDLDTILALFKALTPASYGPAIIALLSMVALNLRRGVDIRTETLPTQEDLP